MEPSDVAAVLGAELGADGRPARLGLMGGTFDPLHNGHIACAEAACRACGLDRVLFIPAGSPNFKQGRRLADGVKRIAWCDAALAEHPRFGVCDIEVRRRGVTYTVDTLRQLRAALPGNVELCFIMGADSAATLQRWQDAEALPGLATYVVVSRPGQALDAALRDELHRAGFRVEYVEDVRCDVSSSDVRVRVASGESVAGLVPEVIRAQVEAELTYRAAAEAAELERGTKARSGLAKFAEAKAAGEERGIPSPFSEELHEEESEGVHMACGGGEKAADAVGGTLDPLSDEFFEARAAELATRVSEKRLAHIKGVANAAAMLAQRYGEDVRKARLAGLLHDWDKGYDNPGIWARVEELACADELDPWVIRNMPQVLHAHTAARALRRDFPQIPADIIQAIDRHTTAALDMTRLDMIVYVADAIEESRQFGRIDELRAAVGNVDLEELFFLTYEYWTFLLFERRKQLHPDTIKVWNMLVAKRAAGKGRE